MTYPALTDIFTITSNNNLRQQHTQTTRVFTIEIPTFRQDSNQSIMINPTTRGPIGLTRTRRDRHYARHHQRRPTVSASFSHGKRTPFTPVLILHIVILHSRIHCLSSSLFVPLSLCPLCSPFSHSFIYLFIHLLIYRSFNLFDPAVQALDWLQCIDRTRQLPVPPDLDPHVRSTHKALTRRDPHFHGASPDNYPSFNNSV